MTWQPENAPAPRDRQFLPGHNRAPGAVLDVDALCHQLEQSGFDWAEKKSAADALDDASKGVLGLCVLRAEGKTVGEKEAHARNDPTFIGHLKAHETARKAALRAHVVYEVSKVRIELTRSNATTERALATMR